jgi:hypothetical protein
MIIHTIEAILEFAATPQFSALRLNSWEQPIERQAEEVIAQRPQESLGVEQSRKASPSHLFLQLVKAEAVRVE